MARKSATDQQLEDLLAYVDKERLQQTDFRAALAAQGAPLPPLERLPGSDAANPLTGDDAGPATTDENGIVAVNAQDVSGPGEDDLDALTAETLRLQQATKDRRAADALKKKEPESDAALRQKTADQLQAALGRAQRVSNLTQRGVRERVFNAADRLGAVSTPGGIGALLVILFVLLLVLLPVNGQPRLVWLWLVLTRKAHLMSESDAANVGGGTVGGSEAAPTHTESNAGGQESAPSLSAAGILAVHANGAQPTYNQQLNSNTPINIGLNGSLSGLDRYINP